MCVVFDHEDQQRFEFIALNNDSSSQASCVLCMFCVVRKSFDGDRPPTGVESCVWCAALVWPGTIKTVRPRTVSVTTWMLDVDVTGVAIVRMSMVSHAT